MINFFVPTKKNNYKPYLLGNVALSIYTVLLLFINTFGGLVGISSVQASTITSKNIVDTTNEYRVKYSLPTLKNDPRLASAALAKANNMMEVGYWSHFGPNGQTPWQFIKASGYTYIYAGENLAKGFKSAEGVVEAWMASPTHRDNILSGNYADIGIAVVQGELLGEDVTLVVQMFGNQTNKVVQTPQNVNADTPRESGETKSISITAPKDKEVLNDANVNIKGEVKGIDGKYVVDITDKNLPIGAFETNGKNWEWDKQSDWSNGEHNIVVKIKDQKVSDSTTFTIDTKAPVLVAFDAQFQTDSWQFSGQLDDINGTASIVSGGYSSSLQVDKSGNFIGILKGENISDTILIITADKLGNSTQIDVSSYFETPSDGSVLSVFNNIIDSLGNRDTLNALFLGFILLLLLSEVITYWRRGILSKHGGSLFTLGFWWILLLFGVAVGFQGGIT